MTSQLVLAMWWTLRLMTKSQKSLLCQLFLQIWPKILFDLSVTWPLTQKGQKLIMSCQCQMTPGGPLYVNSLIFFSHQNWSSYSLGRDSPLIEDSLLSTRRFFCNDIALDIHILPKNNRSLLILFFFRNRFASYGPMILRSKLEKVRREVVPLEKILDKNWLYR